MHKVGASAIVLDLAALAHKNEPESTIINNLNTLLGLIGDIPVGIYESKLPYPRSFTPGLLKSVSGLKNVLFYIDTSTNFQDTKVSSSFFFC